MGITKIDVKKFQNNFAKMVFGITCDEAQKREICVMCQRPCAPGNFKDDLSRKEYQISGTCQKCQDQLFG